MTEYDAFFTIACIAGVLFIFYGPWQELCIEFARQILFEQRERLFDIAARGDMEFDSKEYRELRLNLEKMLRFAHELSLPHFIFLRYAIEHAGATSHSASVVDLVERVENGGVRAELRKIMHQSTTAMVAAMGARSLPILLTMPIIYVLSRCFGFTRSLSLLLRKTGHIVQTEVENAPAPGRFA